MVAELRSSALVFAYLVIDVFDNLKWFNQYGSTADGDRAASTARDCPCSMGRVIPMALLIAVALTISLLGANGELLGMRACGIPVFRVLAPVWLLCGPWPYRPIISWRTKSSPAPLRKRAKIIKTVDIKNQDARPP